MIAEQLDLFATTEPEPVSKPKRKRKSKSKKKPSGPDAYLENEISTLIQANAKCGIRSIGASRTASMIRASMHAVCISRTRGSEQHASA